MVAREHRLAHPLRASASGMPDLYARGAACKQNPATRTTDPTEEAMTDTTRKSNAMTENYNPPMMVPQTLKAELPTGNVATTTAWQSIPKFIRFVIWAYAISLVAGVALGFIALLAIVGA